MYYNKIITTEKINIEGTLLSGQTFLWNTCKNDVTYYCSVIHSVTVIIKPISENKFDVYTSDNLINFLNIHDFFEHFFSLEIESKTVFPDGFSQFYPDIWQLLNKYFSVRIMRQDPFETMISFMCAQGIGMHLIRKQVSMLLQNYGEKRVVSFLGREIIMHRFPSPERLAEADPMMLSSCTNNNRVRARNIIQVSRGVAEGRIDFDFLCDRRLPLSELRSILCQNAGIGYKIADCIALFGLGRFDAFPIDTHVKQYLGKWFNSTTALRSLSPATYLALDREARTILNPDLAGYAGHILFHCWRREIKGLRTF